MSMNTEIYNALWDHAMFQPALIHSEKLVASSENQQ